MGVVFGAGGGVAVGAGVPGDGLEEGAATAGEAVGFGDAAGVGEAAGGEEGGGAACCAHASGVVTSNSGQTRGSQRGAR